MKRSCARMRRWMFQRSDQELPPQQAFELDRHLEECGACRRHQAVLDALDETLAGAPEPEASAAEMAGLVARLQQPDSSPSSVDPSAFLPGPLDGLRSWGRFGGRALFGAAAVALGVLGVWTWQARTAAETRPVPGPGLVPPASELASSAVSPERSSPSSEGLARTSTRGAEAAREPRTSGEVRARLVELLRGAQGEGVASAAFVDGFTSHTTRLAASWPIVRFLEELVHADDAVVARGALLLLAERGDRISALSIQRALHRADRAPQAVAALAGLGDAGLDGLGEALLEPELRPLALEALVVRADESAAELIASHYPRMGAEARTASRDALTRVGAPALPELVRLAGALDRDALLACLEHMPQAAEALSEVLRDGRVPLDVRLAAAERLPSGAALAWLEERILETTSRTAAMASLVRWEGVLPLATLVRLSRSGRLSSEVLDDAVRALCERDPERAAALASEFVARGAGGGEDARDLLALLVASDATQTGAACAILARAELSEDDRLWAALAASERSAQHDAERLAQSFSATPAKERRLRAALLLGLHRVEGEQGLARVLPTGGSRRLGALRRTLADCAELAPTTAVHRVARVLDGVDVSPDSRNAP